MIDEYEHTDADDPRAPPNGNGAGLHVVDPFAVTDPDWARALARTDKGIPTKDAGNAVLILSRSSVWSRALSHNVVSDQIIVAECPPLPHLPDGWDSLPPPAARELCDEHVDYAGLWLRRMWSQSWSEAAIRRALVYAAKLRPNDPIRDYLDACALAWDRRARLDSWVCDYLGAPRLPVNLRIGPMWLISAVARAYKPGAKVDHVLVLEGPQGRGKNKALEIIFGDDYYLPELPDVRDKDAVLALSSSWCACIDELSAIRAADVERTKSFLSRRIDRYRPPYGRDLVSRPRRAVFAATTNVEEYLHDATGNRRTWPVACGIIDHASLARDRDALWGEAVVRYREGEHWWPDDSDTAALREAQAEREQGDEWDDRIAAYARGREWVTVGDCLSDLGLEPADWRPADQHRVTRSLRRAGWASVRERHPGRPRRHWAPIAG